MLAWEIFYSSTKRKIITKVYQIPIPIVLFIIQLYFYSPSSVSTSFFTEFRFFDSHIIALALVSYTLSFNFHFTTCVLQQRAIFERGQAIHRVTSDVQIIHNSNFGSPSGKPDALSPLLSSFVREDSDHYFFNSGNFAIRDIHLHNVYGNSIVDDGAQLILFVLSPEYIRQSGCNPLTDVGLIHWLKEEGDIRVAESRDWGAKKNIVYSPEGGRRASFLRVKYAVFVFEQGSPDSPGSSPEADIPVYIDEWMNQFGCFRVCPVTRGGDSEFEKWKSIYLPHALCPGLVREKNTGIIDKYPRSPDSLIWNPTAENPIIRESIMHQYDKNGAYVCNAKVPSGVWDEPADTMDFLQWLDSCPDCGGFHRFEIEKRRNRPSDMRLGFWNYISWGIKSFFDSLIKGRSKDPEYVVTDKGDCTRPVGEGWEQLKRRYIEWLRSGGSIIYKMSQIFGGGVNEFLLIGFGWLCGLVFSVLFSSGDNSFEMLWVGMGLGLIVGGVVHDIKYWGVPFFGRKSASLAHNKDSKNSKKNDGDLGINAEPLNCDEPFCGEGPADGTPGDGKKYMMGDKFHYHADTSHHGGTIKIGGPTTGAATSDKKKSKKGKVKNEDGSIGMGGVKNKNPYCPLDDITELVRERFRNYLTIPTSLEESTNQDEHVNIEKDLVVHPGFCYQKKAGIEYYNIWSQEFVLNSFIRPATKPTAEESGACSAGGDSEWIFSSLVWLKHPATRLDLPYQVRLGEGEDSESAEAQAKLADLFSQLSPNQPVTKSELESMISKSLGLNMHEGKKIVQSIIQRLVQHQVLVEPEWAANEIASFNSVFLKAGEELRQQGWTILKGLIPSHTMASFTDFYRRLWLKYGAHTAADKFDMQKFNWNDEPFARYLNLEMTNVAEQVVQERLVSGGLALSLWIMKGEGFPLHTDTSPPFDLTMDLVVGHEGKEKRPVTLCRRANGGASNVAMEEMTVGRLGVGDAILFRGSELCHYGGDMYRRDSFHNVVLWTWEYIRD